MSWFCCGHVVVVQWLISHRTVYLLRIGHWPSLGDGACSADASEDGVDLTEVNEAIVVPVKVVRYLLQFNLVHCKTCTVNV